MSDVTKLMGELKEKTVVVEGKKDAAALRELGIRDIVPINGRPLIDVVQGLESRGADEVVILTDFDGEGKRLCSRLITLFQSRRIRTNRRLRKMFRELGKTRIEDFSGFDLASGMSKKRRGDGYGEACASVNKVSDKGKDKSERRDREA